MADNRFEAVRGTVFNIQRYNMHDGDGIRTIVFLKGCGLRCKWCANPEGMLATPQLRLQSAKCVGCGACEKRCPYQLPIRQMLARCNDEFGA